MPNMKEEKELILYPSKNGTVKTLLEEAEKHVEFSEDGSGHLRITEITAHKIVTGPKDDTILDYLQNSTMATNQKIYRIEEIPRDELHLEDDEILISVSHFYKDVFNLFGIPFFVRAKQNEPFHLLKDRIQKKLAIPEKEWEKFKFAIISNGRIEYITDDESSINLAEFRLSPQQQGIPRPYLGLEHINKSQKRAEKAIKIYN